MQKQIQFFKKCTERTNMYTLHPTSMVPVKGIRSIGTYKIAPKKKPTPAAPVVRRLYRDQVPAGSYYSKILRYDNWKTVKKFSGGKTDFFDVVYELEGIGEVYVEYARNRSRDYTKFSKAMMRYGCKTLQDAVGIREWVEVKYNPGQALGYICARGEYPFKRHFCVPPPADTE